MSRDTGNLLATIAIAAIFFGPPFLAWATGRLARHRDQRGHDWSCDCDERRQDARSRHPSGQVMDSASRGMWAELDAFERAAADPHWRSVTDALGAPYAHDYDPDQEAS